MNAVKIKKGEIFCHDCGKEIVQGDKLIIYETEKGNFYKCDQCFEKDEALENFNQTEVYTRIVGYMRPVDQWNVGKSEEYKDRKEFKSNDKDDSDDSSSCA